MYSLYLKYSTRGGIITINLGDDVAHKIEKFRTNKRSVLVKLLERMCSGKEKRIIYNYRDGSSIIELNDEQYKILSSMVYASQMKYYDLVNQYYKHPNPDILAKIEMRAVSKELFSLESYERTTPIHSSTRGDQIPEVPPLRAGHGRSLHHCRGQVNPFVLRCLLPPTRKIYLPVHPRRRH
jgi:hypothetical protein